MTALTQDWATPGIRGITVLDPPMPKDFNGEVLAEGDTVLFALGRGRLAEGIVVTVGLPGEPEAVTIQSIRHPDRRVSIDADGCIKFAV